MTYAERLKDPRWQKRRLEILQRDDWACSVCGCTNKTLHVHHTWYDRDAEPWGAGDSELVTLCEDCHANERESRAESMQLLAEALGMSGFLSRHVIWLAVAVKIHGPREILDPFYGKNLDGE